MAVIGLATGVQFLPCGVVIEPIAYQLAIVERVVVFANSLAAFVAFAGDEDAIARLRLFECPQNCPFATGHDMSPRGSFVSIKRVVCDS